MSEHSKELVWSQLVDEGEYASASKVAPGANAAEFTGITVEVEKLRVELSIALSAAAEFLNSGDQPSTRAEALLSDIDYLQEVLSMTAWLESHTVLRIAEITPQLEAIALLKLG